MEKVLVGDVGGTKVRLALFGSIEDDLDGLDAAWYRCVEYRSFETIVRDFLGETTVSRAVFGVPGPVLDGRAHLTNLPWVLEEGHLRTALGIERVNLVNDLSATAYSLPWLRPGIELRVLHQGEAVHGGAVSAILSPGTGLGHSFVYREGEILRVFPSEGGHADFAPTSEIAVSLWRYLRRKYGRATYESVLSGPGLVDIYEFFLYERNSEPSVSLRECFDAGDDAAKTISKFALDGTDEHCVDSLDLFLDILGSQAGNCVLTMMALGGVYLGGGILPQILQNRQEQRVCESYLNKGSWRRIVERASLSLIVDDRVSLRGAASIAFAR